MALITEIRPSNVRSLTERATRPSSSDDESDSTAPKRDACLLPAPPTAIGRATPDLELSPDDVELVSSDSESSPPQKRPRLLDAMVAAACRGDRVGNLWGRRVWGRWVGVGSTGEQPAGRRGGGREAVGAQRERGALAAAGGGLPAGATTARRATCSRKQAVAGLRVRGAATRGARPRNARV
jgi:hypothetical protein